MLDFEWLLALQSFPARSGLLSIITSWTGDIYADIETEMFAPAEKCKAVRAVVWAKGRKQCRACDDTDAGHA